MQPTRTREPLLSASPALATAAAATTASAIPEPNAARPADRDEPARVESLTRVLRGIGAAVVAASAATFLLQNWESGNDLTRYFWLLGHTAVLTGTGFFCAIRMRESKGARTFLGLAAGLVPALFCILGGLVYSQWSLDGGTFPVPHYASWAAPTRLAAVQTAAVTLAFAAPVAFLAFLSLARSRAKSLSVAFMLGNSALLLPTREADVMAALLAALAVMLAALELRVWSRDSGMRTAEGVLARGLLLAAPLLLVARSALHYELSYFMAAVLLFSGAGAAFFAGGLGAVRGHARDLAQTSSVLPLGAGWLCVAAGLGSSVAIHPALIVPVGALGFAATLVGMSLVARSNPALYRQVAVVVALGSMGLNLLSHPGILSAFLCLVAGIIATGYGFLFERRWLFGLGILGIGVSLVSHVHYAIELYAHLHWGSLSLLGIAVILSASLLERHSGLMARQIDSLRARARELDAVSID